MYGARIPAGNSICNEHTHSDRTVAQHSPTQVHCDRQEAVTLQGGQSDNLSSKFLRTSVLPAPCCLDDCRAATRPDELAAEQQEVRDAEQCHRCYPATYGDMLVLSPLL